MFWRLTIVSKNWTKKAGCPKCGKDCANANFNARMWYCLRIGKTVFENQVPDVSQEGAWGNPSLQRGVSPKEASEVKSGQLLLKFSEQNNNSSHYDFEV